MLSTRTTGSHGAGMLRTSHAALVSMLAALFVVGCSAGLKCPADGGAAWRELRSSHFILQTDAGERESLDALRALETSRDAMRLTFPSGAEPDGIIDVVLFEDAASFHRFIPPRIQGMTRLPTFESLNDRPRIASYFDGPFDARVLIQHEVAHTFIHFYYPSVPMWLDEGLAEYLSTLLIEGGRLVIGRPVPFRPATAHAVPLAELLGATRETFYRGDGLARDAWALVHLLKSRTDDHRGAFDRYLDRLAAGEEAMAAWRAVFSTQQETTISRQYESYGRRKTLNVLRTTYQAPAEPGITVLPMNDYEVHRSWSKLYANSGDQLAQLDEAIRQCPTCARLYTARARVHDLSGAHASGDADVAAATRLDAADPAVRFELLFRLLKWGRAPELPGSDKPVADIVEALDGLRDAAAQRLLAQYFIANGDVDRAISSAELATTIDINCATCFETYGAALAGRGRFSEAAEAQRRAIVLLRHSEEQAARLGKLQEYEEQAMRAMGQ